MEVFEALRNRRSVRRFSEETVSREDLQKVLEAAQWAPSWVNVQPWRVVVVEAANTKAALKETASPQEPCSQGF